MQNIIIVLILILILGGISLYIKKAKKRGEKCIGCPNAKNCTKCHRNESPFPDKHEKIEINW